MTESQSVEGVIGNTIPQRLGKLIDNISGAYCYILMTGVFIFGFLLTFEAIAGKYFAFSTVWINFACTQLMALTPFFLAGYAMRQFQHVRVALFENLMAPRTALWSQLFGWLMFLAFGIICFYYLLISTRDAYSFGDIFDALILPVWPVYFLAAFGCLILILQTVRGMITVTGQLTPDLAGSRGFIGSPVFVIGIYVIAIVLSIWLFTVNPPIGVFALLIVLLFSGIPVAAAICYLAIIGLFIFGGINYMEALGMNLYKSMEEFTWFAFPLFVLAGFAMQKGQVTEGLFKMVANWIGWIPGGVGIAVMATAVLLGAMLGSLYATLALLMILCLPELDKRNYPRSLTLPMIASSSVLGYLIPPSIMMVVLGTLTDNSIGALFMAGVGPGIVLALVFSAYVFFFSLRNPNIQTMSATWKERFTSIPPNIPALLIIFLIVGTIITGYLTPTEAAGLAVAYIFALNVIRGKMKFFLAVNRNEENKKTIAVDIKGTINDFKETFNAAANVIGFLSLIIVGALVSKLALMHFHVGEEIVKLVMQVGVGKLALLVVITFILFLMGCIGESLPIVIIMIPTVFPVLYQLGIHPWWVVIYLVMMGGISGLTPPVGMALFAVAGMSGTPPSFIFRHILPWVGLLFVSIVITYFFPVLVTWLPVLVGFSQPPGF
jgi:C4-dicarboxylate transporter DctM subunit